STYSIPSGKKDITANDFKNTVGLDLEESFVQKTLIEPYLNTFGKTQFLDNGVWLVRVYSYGAFTSSSNDYTCATAFGLITSSPNEDITTAGNKTHIVSVDHPLSRDEIKNRYQAVDNVDSDITAQMAFDTNYYKDYFDIGTYYVYTTITDSKNNTATAMDIVQVIDFVPPQLSLSKEIYEFDVKTPFTSKDAQSFFSASDNFSTGNDLKIFFTDQFQNQYNTVGTYTISAYAIDKGNNKSETKELEIRVVDHIKPVISLVAGGNTITSFTELSDSEIKALLQVTDNYYDIPSENIEIVSNTCNGDQGVEFEIVVQVKDGSGNIGDATFTYILADTTAPIILVKKTIYIPLGKTYSNDEIIELLKEAGLLSPDATHVDLTSSIDSFEQEGIYSISYVETFADGTVQEGSASLAIFTPAESPKDPSTSISPWYIFLFVLPMVLTLLFIVLKRNHEKD
ncbi:hypothetical protein HDR67_02395, partial [bacterium]|nr:hypothetical protein [bacterium]